MEQYTDDERVEDLKKWWKENGASILIGIAFGVIAIFGWRYWLSHRDTQAEIASRAYDAFVAAVEKPDADQARQRGQALTTDFPKSPYAALAALRLAHLALAGGDHASAAQQLEWAISHARLDELRDIARLRLARVKLAAGQTAEAGKLLESVATASLSAEREELKGDLYLAGNQPDQARTAYAVALAASGGDRLLQLKIDNLTMATSDTVVPAPSAPPAPPAPPPQAESAKPASALAAPVEPAATSAAPAAQSATESAATPPPTEPAPVPALPLSTEPVPTPMPVPPAATSGQ
jgi:predicted negative regulator of RcsB-dependent stress response